MPRSRKLLVLAIPAVIALLLAACGDDDGGGATSFTVEASDFEFSPNAWAVAADTDVTITFRNEGLVAHEWAVLTEGTNIESGAEFAEELVELEVEAVPAGDTVTQTFNLPAGTYQVICALEDHFDAGMEGTLTVSG
jgi:plastocyanin